MATNTPKRTIEGEELFELHNWRAHVTLSAWQYDIVPIEIACTGHDKDGHRLQYGVSGFVLTVIDEDTYNIDDIAQVKLDTTNAAALAEMLWNAGARASSAKSSQGYRDAAESHILDLRAELLKAHQHIEQLQAIIAMMTPREPST